MPINRDTQRRLLELLAPQFDHFVDLQHEDRLGFERADMDFQLAYLEEHGLVECKRAGMDRIIIMARITAKGLDFLEEDGGLSAILGVVTIRLHDDTIKELIAQKILESDLAQPDKRRYLDALRELPAETTKHVVLKLVDMGLAAGPKAMEWLGKQLPALLA